MAAYLKARDAGLPWPVRAVGAVLNLYCATVIKKVLGNHKECPLGDCWSGWGERLIRIEDHSLLILHLQNADLPHSAHKSGRRHRRDPKQ